MKNQLENKGEPTVSRGLALLACLSFWMPLLAFSAQAAGKAEYVVVMVWDGLRPDCITPRLTPELYALSQKGVFFNHHHPVYISSTEVNGTALITGAYPEHSGIGGNREYRPGISFTEPYGTESLEVVRRADWLMGGHYIAVPTLTEAIQTAGFRTVVAGTKGVALLLDRSCDRVSPAAQQSVNLFKGRTVPSMVMTQMVKDLDGVAFPKAIHHPNRQQDAWTTRALTQSLWKNGVPKLSVLWMSDPDFSQHFGHPGSWTARRGLRSADSNLATVLRVLEEKGIRDKTDVFIVSDHGFSTVDHGVDVVDLLKKDKFKAVSKFDEPERGQVLVVGLGGSLALYVAGHDETVIRNLTAFFQKQDFTGVIFTRFPVDGAFLVDQVRLRLTNGPDMVVSMRWNRKLNSSGLPGLIITDGGWRGRGAHGSLSPFDMHNSLVAAGPDFKCGMVDEMPSGNIDLAPTVLHILGIPPIQPMDGRVLVEAFAQSGESVPKVEHKTIRTSQPQSQWRQYLKYSVVGNSIYFDEGNGKGVRKSAEETGTE